jgi:GH43 family beta-xylosidase
MVFYFAATGTKALDALNMFQHRMFVPCADAILLPGPGSKRPEITFDTFALDATTFVHQGKRWYLWAQKSPAYRG